MAIVYLATNRVNGKQYVGFTSRSLPERRKEHWYAKKSLECRAFHGALLKYGLSAFVWNVLEVGSEPEMLAAESKWISSLETLGPLGYNLTTGGDRPQLGPEGRALNSTRQKGLRKSPEARAAMSAAKKDRPLSPIARASMATWIKNPAVLVRMREAAIARHRKSQDPALAFRVLDALESGMSCRAVACREGISGPTVAAIRDGRNGWQQIVWAEIQSMREESC